MKKGLLSILALLVLVATLGLSSCIDDDEPYYCQHQDANNNSLCDKCEEVYQHTHNFVKEDTDDKHLVSEADCENAAIYYYSCSCGENDTKTFTYGPAKGHTYISDTCPDCGYEIVYSEGLEFCLTSNADGYSVIGIGTCTDTDIIIPPTYNGLPVIYIDDAFKECYNLTSVIIPDSVIHIGYEAFYECNNIRSVRIGNSVEYIGAYAFYKCSRLTSVIIPDSVTRIGESSFSNCTDLKSAIIGNGVTIIGAAAFYECLDLSSVTFGNSITSIEFGAFYYCSSLRSVTLPATVTNIGSRAFMECRNLITFNYRGSESKWSDVTKGELWNFNIDIIMVVCNYKGK